MPTLLQINSCANWGSTGKIAEQINRAAAKKGWKTYIAYGREIIQGQSVPIRIGNIVSQAFALVEARLFDNDGLANRWATRRLVKTIKKINPDVIHLHNLHGYYINYKVLFKYLNTSGIPVVWTFHDCWAFTGHCAHFVSANCENWKKECNNCPLKNNYPASWWRDRSRRNFMMKKSLFSANKGLQIIAVSQWLGDLVKQSFLKTSDVKVIKNGVDLKLFRPLPSQPNKRFRVLGVSSVWTGAKGLYDFYQLREYLHEEEYDIVLVGLNEEQIKDLPKGILGIARTNSVEELVEYYSTADVYVNPTHLDSFPTTNLEAMACGTPVITYRTGGSPESVTPKTGFVVEQGSVEEIVDAIYTIRDRGKSHYSQACRRRVETCFNKERNCSDYLEVYKELIVD